MRRASLAVGAFLLVLGGLAAAEALRLGDGWQGPGLMPAAVGAALAALGLAHLVAPPGSPPPWPGAVALRRVVAMLGLLAAYVAALPYLGFLPATALFTLAVVRWLGRFGWARALATTAAIAVAGHVVFLRWLGMPLPRAFTGW